MFTCIHSAICNLQPYLQYVVHTANISAMREPSWIHLCLLPRPCRTSPLPQLPPTTHHAMHDIMASLCTSLLRATLARCPALALGAVLPITPCRDKQQHYALHSVEPALPAAPPLCLLPFFLSHHAYVNSNTMCLVGSAFAWYSVLLFFLYCHQIPTMPCKARWHTYAQALLAQHCASIAACSLLYHA